MRNMVKYIIITSLFVFIAFLAITILDKVWLYGLATYFAGLAYGFGWGETHERIKQENE